MLYLLASAADSNVDEQIFENLNAHLRETDITVFQPTTLNATVVAVPISTVNVTKGWSVEVL